MKFSPALMVCCALAAGTGCWSQPPLAKPVKVRPAPVRAPLPVSQSSFAVDVCRLIENRSRWRGIDPHFIARLIDIESRFSPTAVSPAGAEGIAQFMPGTAKLRNLANPFDPAAALTASIDYLAHLKASFGNAGLAAVAYNAGEGAAARFVKGGGIPLETENYVYTITGRAADAWRQPKVEFPIAPIHKTKPFHSACIGLVNKPGKVRFAGPAAPRQPWGVQVAEHFSRATAARIYRRLRVRFPGKLATRRAMMVRVRNRSFGTRLRHAARIGAKSRAEAISICKTLKSRGLACLVRKTR